MEGIGLYCIGTNHRTAPLEIREKLWCGPEDARSFLSDIQGKFVREAVLISTCNRTELYAVPLSPSVSAVSLWKELLHFKRAGQSDVAEDPYTLPSLHAIRHLFAVASGIDSMVPGDVQIVNQLKSAYRIAQESGSVGPVLHRAFMQAFHTGKRARTETELGEGATSIGHATAELVAKIFGNLSDRSGLLIGAGETGELAARHLRSNGLKNLRITNRTRERAERLAAELGGATIDFNVYKESLSTVDIVISSVSTHDYILHPDDVRRAQKRRNNKPLVIIDLGVPRNVNPDVYTVENIFLHDVDGLQHIVHQNLSRRRKELPTIQRIILEELRQFKEWQSASQLAPTVHDLREQFEKIRAREIGRIRNRFEPAVYDEISLITSRIVNKILHGPMVHLRGRARQGTAFEIRQDLHLLRSLFGLDPTPSLCQGECKSEGIPIDQ